MTGTDIIGTLLYAHGPLLAMVPTNRIKAGMLPETIALPALLVRTVDAVERQHLKRGNSVRITERVSVTVRAQNYGQQVAIIRLVRQHCAGWTGNMAGAANIAILSAGTGPDLVGPGNTFEQAQDFRLSFEEPT